MRDRVECKDTLKKHPIRYLIVVSSRKTKVTDCKTIYSRIGNIKLGKFIDEDTGENFASSLSDVETILDTLDIKLRSSQGEFNNFGEILDKLGDKWSTLSDVEKSVVSSTFAGLRQREVFAVLMNNYGNSLKYAEAAANSSGTALQKFGNYQEGIEAKLKRTEAAFQELSMAIVNSDMFRALLDMSNSLIQGFTGFVDVVKPIPMLIGAISLAMSALGKNAGKSSICLCSIVICYKVNDYIG